MIVITNKLVSLKLGDKVSMKRVATAEIVRQIAEISDDKNPVHFSEVVLDGSTEVKVI